AFRPMIGRKARMALLPLAFAVDVTCRDPLACESAWDHEAASPCPLCAKSGRHGTALPIMSALRFWLWGSLGMGYCAFPRANVEGSMNRQKINGICAKAPLIMSGPPSYGCWATLPAQATPSITAAMRGLVSTYSGS